MNKLVIAILFGTMFGVNTGGAPVFNLYHAIPFLGILLSIAIIPLVNHHFWEKNFGKISLFWSLAFIIPFYFLVHNFSIVTETLLHTLTFEYIPFIILLLSLFTVSGGICLKGKLVGTPQLNLIILLIGTILASWMGTTGAAMLLIRPLLRANKWRVHKVHIVVFFIFLVANIGGALTPLGDPPLFLGFLKGVKFFWTTEYLLLPMLYVSTILLVLFYFVDNYYYKKETNRPIETTDIKSIEISGKINFLFLALIVGSVLMSGFWKPGSNITGFQFNHNGCVTEASGGDAEANNFIISANENMVRARGLIGETIPAGLGTLVELSGNVTEDCLSDFMFSNSDKAIHNLKDGFGENRECKDEVCLSLDDGHLNYTTNYQIHIYGNVSMELQNLIRDILLLFITFLSIHFTSRAVRSQNGFTWFPIVEVSKLFMGIFITIIPVISILAIKDIGGLQWIKDLCSTDLMYFWITGFLSSFLDNAPTYLVFFDVAGGDPIILMGKMKSTLIAISSGAVFMGAMTYIGNAPNFMVRAIAEENGVKMPSFFGFMAWSFIILGLTFISYSLIFLL